MDEGAQSNIWCETYSEEGKYRWKVFRFQEGQDYLIAKSEQGYSELFDVVDAANEYCDCHGIVARWNVPMAV